MLLRQPVTVIGRIIIQLIPAKHNVRLVEPKLPIYVYLYVEHNAVKSMCLLTLTKGHTTNYLVHSLMTTYNKAIFNTMPLALVQ